MYCIHTKCAPPYLCNIVPVSHSYSTRKSSMSYVLPNVKSQGSKTFKYNAIKLWNDLPNSVKESDSKESFKRNCKLYQMEKMKLLELNEFTS